MCLFWTCRMTWVCVWLFYDFLFSSFLDTKVVSSCSSEHEWDCAFNGFSLYRPFPVKPWLVMSTGIGLLASTNSWLDFLVWRSQISIGLKHQELVPPSPEGQTSGIKRLAVFPYSPWGRILPQPFQLLGRLATSASDSHGHLPRDFPLSVSTFPFSFKDSGIAGSPVWWPWL